MDTEQQHERRRAIDADMDDLKGQVSRLSGVVEQIAATQKQISDRQVDWQSTYGDLLRDALCRKKWWKDVLSEAQKGGVIWTLRLLAVASAVGLYQIAKQNWHKIGL